MLSNDPVAAEIRPGTSAVKATPWPTLCGFGDGPSAGGYGRSGAVVHGTSCHAILGYSAVKHPAFGLGNRDIASRQALRFAASSGDSFVAAASGDAAVARLDSGPDDRPATSKTPRIFVMHPRAALKDFMAALMNWTERDLVGQRCSESVGLTCL
jgi:hypothetical protein